jgi:Ca2+-binding RTX toxin-like protein
LYGMGGNDVLDGQFGLDILYGGPGDDIFLVGTGAQVVELSGEGTDLVSTSGANYTLSDHVENLWSAGSATGQSLTGNALANSIRGSDAADVLSGLGGDDLLEGSAGSDTLYGDDGNDTLIGGTGSNSLYGGAGDDLLQIRVGSSDNVLDGGDGFDTLWVRTSTTLTANLASIERVQFDTVNVTLTMTSLQAAGLSSNADFTAHGTGVGRIVINMTPGVQLIATQFTLSSDVVAFTVNGTTGTDVIKGPLTAAMTVSAGDGADQIRTGNLADTIDSGAGNDKIMGLGGADMLTGGAGADQFRYLFATDSGLGTGADQILDFSNGSDKLDFRVLDADPALSGRQALTFIGSAAFASDGSAQVRYADVGADTRVEIDLNGDGAADMQILLVGHAGQALAGTDFLL